MKKYITTFLIFFLFKCTGTKPKLDIPDWFLNIPQIDGEIVSVGTGQKEGEALLNGLYPLFNSIIESHSMRVEEMSGKSDVNVNTWTSIQKSVLNEYFGKLLIEGVFKRVEEEINDRAVIDTYSRTIRLTYFDDNEGIILRSAQEEIDDIATIDIFEIIPPTINLDPIYTELEKNGIFVRKKYEHNDQHFLMLSIDESAAKRLTEKGRSEASLEELEKDLELYEKFKAQQTNDPSDEE